MVTTDEAIKKGLYTVNLPAMLIFAIGLIGSFILAFMFFNTFGMAIMLFASYLLATAYRAVMSARWRIWAFNNVRNVHELYERAVTEKLLFETSKPGFGIINYNTERQKEQWELIKSKFGQPDVFTDDQSIPSETVIRYSLVKTLFWTTVFLLMTVFGVYLFSLGRLVGYIFGTVLILTGAVNAYLKFKRVFNRKPQVIITDECITTNGNAYHKWAEVANEKVIREGTGKYATYYLCYDHPNGSIKFLLDDLDVNFRRLQKLLGVYRGRYEQGVRIIKK